MKQITISERGIKCLLEYINTVVDLIDTESMEYEKSEIIVDGYDDFVEPILKMVYDC